VSSLPVKPVAIAQPIFAKKIPAAAAVVNVPLEICQFCKLEFKPSELPGNFLKILW
jgi:hypothetical protein